MSTPHTKHSSLRICSSIIWHFLRELAALRMSFRMVIKLPLVIQRVFLFPVCVCVYACFSMNPTLYIISSPTRGEYGGGGTLLSDELHRYCGLGWGSEPDNLLSACAHKHTIWFLCIHLGFIQVAMCFSCKFAGLNCSFVSLRWKCLVNGLDFNVSQ